MIDGLVRALRGIRGALDVASVMVGVIVIGTIAGAAMGTFALVIPWSQDQAAQTSLQAVRTAERVVYTLEGQYLDFDDLVDADLVQPAPAVTVATGDDGHCWAAAIRSVSGNTFWADSAHETVQVYVPDESASPCVDLETIRP